MKKMLLLFVLAISMQMEAQEISFNAGSYLVTESDQGAAKDSHYYGGYLELAGDILSQSKFRLAPVFKFYLHQDGISNGTDTSKNADYFLGLGAEIGYDFNEDVSFAVGYELPLPGSRENIWEATVSPSLLFGLGNGHWGLKINYDYFINKQRLFTYNHMISAGVIYKL